MRILFLGYPDCELLTFLRNDSSVELDQLEEKINPAYLKNKTYDLAVSYGYRYLIPLEIIWCLQNRMINLHISYLPWNRGADPNFWSFMDNTPKGVTIHMIGRGIDTGPILFQQEIKMKADEETLKSSYVKLNAAIQKLFMTHWDKIKKWEVDLAAQSEEGSFHKSSESELFKKNIPNFYELKISELISKVSELKQTQANSP